MPFRSQDWESRQETGFLSVDPSPQEDSVQPYPDSELDLRPGTKMHHFHRRKEELDGRLGASTVEESRSNSVSGSDLAPTIQEEPSSSAVSLDRGLSPSNRDRNTASDPIPSSRPPSPATPAASPSSPSPPPPPPGRLSPLRTAIGNFSSQWFLVPQGTGITSVVLYRLESRFPGLDGISYAVWAFTGASLVFMLMAYLVRASLHPWRVLGLLMADAAELACLSSVSIALTSINQMAALVAVRPGDVDDASSAGAGRRGWADLTVALWWANAALAVPSMLLIPYAFAHVQPRPGGVARLAPSTQLPMVAAITLAAGGGVVAGCLPGAALGDAQVAIVLVSYLSLALAMPVAMAFSTMYLVRLLDGSPPAPGRVYQEMIFAGPWGQGSFALQVLGGVMVEHAASFSGYSAGDMLTESSVAVMGYCSMFLGFLSWGQGTFWWFFACMSSVQSHVRAWRARFRGGDLERERYSLAGWALVFPWGVYTNAAVELGRLLQSSAFRIWSTVLTICLVILMLGNLVLTAKGLWKGTLLGIDKRPRRPRECHSEEVKMSS